MATTIQIDERQLKRLMEEKIKYRVSYKLVLEGYFRLIKDFKLREEFDKVMEQIKHENNKGTKEEREYWKTLSKKDGAYK